MYSFIETMPGKEQFDMFESVPGHIYPYFKRQAAQKNQYNHNFLVNGIIILQDGTPVGRVALYINPFLRHKGLRCGAIGNYECVDDLNVSQALLQYAAEDLRNRGAQMIIGPFNGSTWDSYRFLMNHDQPNFFLEPYNPPYYTTQFQAFGFETLATYTSSLDHEMKLGNEKTLARMAHFKEEGVVFRPIRLDDYEAELKKVYTFCLQGFSRNFLFTPISEESFMDKYLPLQNYIDPELVLLAEAPEGHLVGMMFCIQDFLNVDERSLVIKTVARMPGREWAGMGNVLVHQIMQTARTRNFDSTIHAFMLEHGNGHGLSKGNAGHVYKRYHLFGMELTGEEQDIPDAEEALASA